MNNTNPEEILKELGRYAQQTGLTASEKDALRQKFRQFMVGHLNDVLVAADPVTAPINPFINFFLRPHPVFAVVAVTFVLGGGVVYASQGALPGDLLYGLKVGVVEKLESAMTVSVEHRAAVSVRQAVRRLEEAETLIRQNKLDSRGKSELSQKFTEKADEVARDLEALKIDHRDSKAREIDDNFQVMMKEHRDILQKIEHREEKSEDLKREPEDQSPARDSQPVTGTVKTPVVESVVEPVKMPVVSPEVESIIAPALIPVVAPLPEKEVAIEEVQVQEVTAEDIKLPELNTQEMEILKTEQLNTELLRTESIRTELLNTELFNTEVRDAL